MIQKLQLINPLVNVPMATKPSTILQLRFNLSKPFFCAIIHGTLVNAGQKCFYRNIPLRAGVTQNDIHLPVQILQLLHYSAFNLIRRLLIRKPVHVHTEPIPLINGVCTTNNKCALSIQVINFTVFCKQQIRISIFYINSAALPLIITKRTRAGSPI